MAIGVHTQGRTGNQMFQFAFAYSLSKKLNTSFFVEDLSALNWFELYNKYYIKNKFTYLKVRTRHIFKRLIKKNQEKTFQSLNILNINDWSSADTIVDILKNNSFYVGYFQSLDFFRKNSEEIKKLFSIKQSFQNAFRLQKGQYLEEKYIAVHIRRTDYVNWQLEGLGEKNYSLPLNYYLNCFKEIKDLENYKIVFLSDDEQFYHDNFSYLKNSVYERNSQAMDFQILKNAEIIILSNSSFAWWAAFLSDNPKMIMAPEFWLGFKVKKEFPPHIINPNWKKISFN